MLPENLVDELDHGAHVIEVGVGARWDTLRWLQDVRPDLRLSATDVREAALDGAPPHVDTFVDDVFDADVSRYAGAHLLFAVRCPEELQAPLARLAAIVGARLAMVVLKDELADVRRWVGPARLDNDGRGRTWRVHAPIAD